MGTVRRPQPVKLVASMFSGRPELLESAEAALQEHFGPVDYQSPLIAFEHTHYYTPEFGSGLQRRFIAFDRLVDPQDLADIKLLTNSLEQRWAEHGRRRINLDPGYVSRAKLVLATTKDFAHRIYLGRGIYAEVTLTFRQGEWRPWPWTYPDYASTPYLEVFRHIRALYVQQLQCAKPRSQSSGPRGPIPRSD